MNMVFMLAKKKYNNKYGPHNICICYWNFLLTCFVIRVEFRILGSWYFFFHTVLNVKYLSTYITVQKFFMKNFPNSDMPHA